MDNRINETRKRIRALRVSMLEAEAIMHEQINRDEECSFVAGEILKMCVVMSVLVRERESLGDREPILVDQLLHSPASSDGAQTSCSALGEASSLPRRTTCRMTPWNTRNGPGRQPLPSEELSWTETLSG